MLTVGEVPLKKDCKIDGVVTVSHTFGLQIASCTLVILGIAMLVCCSYNIVEVIILLTIFRQEGKPGNLSVKAL